MDGLSNIFVALSTLPALPLILLFLLITLITGLCGWITASYGISVHGVSIGGKHIEARNSRHDAFLKEDLQAEIMMKEADYRSDCNDYICRRNYDLIALTGTTNCSFPSFALNTLFEGICRAVISKSSFSQRLAARNRHLLVISVSQQMEKEYEGIVTKLRLSPCDEKMAEFNAVKPKVMDLIQALFDELALLTQVHIKEEIRIYNEYRKMFKDDFYKANACDKHINRLQLILDNLS